VSKSEIAALAAVVTALAGLWTAGATTDVSTQVTLVATTVIAALYALVQGARRFQQDQKRGWFRPEFYVSLLQVAAVIGATLLSSHAIPIRDVAMVNAAIAAAYTLSRSLAKPSAGAGSTSGIRVAPGTPPPSVPHVTAPVEPRPVVPLV
jgi:hypothetical protein